ncbi:hypothetical protein ACHAXR_013397 [Thalassiosira sp. AJA248-18]
MYDSGKFMENDEKKALHHYQCAAMGGCEQSRYNLGCLGIDRDRGNVERAIKHWMVAATAGGNRSLKSIRNVFLLGQATKAEYEKALRVHQKYLREVKSDQRDRANDAIPIASHQIGPF